MESSEPTAEIHDGSREVAALAALNSASVEPHQRRRVRRRRRSLRRRLVDSLMPFAILVGLTVFAAGVVSVVEIGAAKNSKVKSVYNGEITSYEAPSSEDFAVEQEQYYNLMRKHSQLKGKKQKPVSQVAYQLGLANQAVRELSGLDEVIPAPDKPGVDDIMDWDLFEAGSENPRSTLQRTGATTR